MNDGHILKFITAFRGWEVWISKYRLQPPSASDRLRLAINTVRTAVYLFASALKLYKER
jgi:hypothetical protein